MDGFKVKNLEQRRERLLEQFPVWEPMTIWERFEEAAGKWGDNCLIADGDRAFTYREEEKRGLLAAGAFKRLGVKPKDRVALCMGNREEFVPITLGLARLGAVKVPLNRRAGLDEIRYILNQAGAQILILEDGAGGCTLKELEALAGIQRMICLDGKTAGGKALSWEDFLALGQGAQTKEHGDAGAVSDLIYTSGSTGKPKGVPLTHDALLRSAFAGCLNRGFEPGWRIYVPLPLFHVYGYVEGLLASLFVGGGLVVTRGKFKAGDALAAMNRWQVTDILSVPLIMMKLLGEPGLSERPVKSLKAVYCSASVCPKWVWEDIRRVFRVDEVITGYGMTEVCGASMQTDPADGDEILKSRVGRILSGGPAGMDLPGRPVIEYRVIDGETGKDMPPGVYGELICRGPIVAEGYYHMPKLAGGCAEGWFHTGDIGYFDEKGYLRLLGRCNDIYKINGENVSPQFLDKVISRCQGVAAVETVGVHDERAGWVGAAFVELKAGTAPQAVKDYCFENLAPYQAPKYFFFGDSGDWPRTSTGKVQKFKLRERAEELIKEGYGGI